MILHKYPTVTPQQMDKVHPRLMEILNLCSHLSDLWYSDPIVVTAIFDPNHPGLTHRLNEVRHRFVDFSILKTGGINGSERLRNTINAAYKYDGAPNLLTIPDLFHKGTLSGSTAPHFHVQIGPWWLNHLVYPIPN